MKRKLCLVLVFLLVALTACENKNKSLSQKEINAKISESDNKDGQDNTNPKQDVQVVAPTSVMVGIYTIEDDTLNTTSIDTVVQIDGELKAEDVVNAVVSELEDHDIDIVIASVTNEGGKVTIDIEADDPFLPFGSLGSSAEGSVLDCLSYSIFDNFADVNAVYFHVNGEAYETGHIVLKADEPYLTR